MTRVVPISVVVPTVGRVELLEACLDSILACVPAPAEVLVVDQSDGAITRPLATRAGERLRLIACGLRGAAHARNHGLEQANHDLVAFTDDDCTVAPNWVEMGWRMMAADSRRIATGRVLPGAGSPGAPSTKDSMVSRDYLGEVRSGVLFTNNMVVARSMLLELGGFDERLWLAAEDNDLCYRWLRAGLRLSYEPELLIWHHPWRSTQELERVYARYWEGQGEFYAKHLRQRDAAVLRLVARELRSGLADLTRRRGMRKSPEPWEGRLRGLARGLATGWSKFAGGSDTDREVAR